MTGVELALLRSRLTLVLCAIALSFGAAAADDAMPVPKPEAVVPAPPPTPARIIDPEVCIDPAAADCSILINAETTERRPRIAALLIRAKALVAADQSARALADYDAALKLDPTMTDVLNMRGELRRAMGDRPRALADFTAVLTVRPDHEKARENRKSLSKEIEKMGAEMAIGKRPPPPAALK